MVSSDKTNEIVMCQCMKFDMFGILCSHALKVLDLLDIKSIPEKYILRRWTRCARDEIMEQTDRDVEVK
ncbi:Protein FAR1-RELATED SEQUENCE 7 [Platanthera zijinensis]|uniref:Protein FAR1-RELATED SEQUENCE n=1 Tax=Platanthera zijinensis TaxID=2320716 RepID=A0AAP0BEL4_9ASPA